jgi:nitrite reductase/ring-hydroxylating ferredoxin subunit
VDDGWITVGREADIPTGEMRAFELGSAHVAVGHLEDGSWVAFDDMCTHEACSLSDQGEIEGPWVVCYCHNSAFDIATGAVMRGPAEDPLPVYGVRAEGGDVQVRTPP